MQPRKIDFDVDIKEKLSIKINNFYGDFKNENFFRKMTDEIQSKPKIFCKSPLKIKQLIIESSNFRISDCDEDEVIGINEIKTLEYKNNIEFIRENHLENKNFMRNNSYSSIIKFKSPKIFFDLKKCKSFSFLNKKGENLCLQKEEEISNFCPSEDNPKNPEMDQTLVTYMHDAFEKMAKPNKTIHLEPKN